VNPFVVTSFVRRRSLPLVVWWCLVAFVASCGTSAHRAAMAPSSGRGPGDVRASSGSVVPASYVALDLNPQGDVRLQLFSTADGSLVRSLNLSGLSSDVYPSDLSSVAVAGDTAYWGAVQNDNVTTSEGHIVATPLDGGDSKVLTTGVGPISSPDGKRLFIVQTTQQAGRIASGFSLFDLATGRTTVLPALAPVRAFVTFAWLPDSHTVVALYPGYSGCSGPAACLPVPVDPAPAAWTLDTSVIPQIWRPVPDLTSEVAGMRLLGPGPASGSVTAALPGGTEKVTVLNVAAGLFPSGREATLEGSCDGVDNTGLNFICTSGQGIVTFSLDNPHPRTIGPAGLTNYELAWS
jgi:hypothetical protein